MPGTCEFIPKPNELPTGFLVTISTPEVCAFTAMQESEKRKGNSNIFIKL